MAKATLEAGGVIDILGGDEYAHGTEKLAGKLDKLRDQLAAIDSPPTLIRVPVPLVTDGSGNLGGGAAATNPAVLYRCPQGQTARVVRFAVDDATHTPAAPLAAGWLAAYVDSVQPPNLALALPPIGSTTVLPAIYTDGTHSATMIRDGQALVVIGAALPTNATIGFGLQVWLYPTSGRPE